MMYELAPHRPSFLRPLDAGLLVVGAALLSVVILVSLAFAADAGVALTRGTVRLSLCWYFATLLLIMRLDRGDWPATTAAGRLARWCWTWGLACFLVHVGMAFHHYHHWSHADAFERTRQISGLGEGIYFSYLFALLWGADAAAWWLAPAKFATRSPWLDRALHGYMLFMVANGMIVYETGPIRWAGIAMFSILPIAWLAARRRRSFAR
jgi:hypothetical protein